MFFCFSLLIPYQISVNGRGDLRGAQGDLRGIPGAAHPLEPILKNINKRNLSFPVINSKHVDKILMEGE